MPYDNRGRGGGGYDNRQGGGQQFDYVSNRGAMWQRDSTGPQSPDYTGEFTLAKEVLDYILQNARSGAVKLEIATWRKVDRNGQPFVSLKIQTPYSERQQQQEYRPQPRRQDRRDGGYAQQSGRDDYRNDPPSRQYVERQRSTREFARGDQMPDFNLDDDDPNAPPF